MARCNFTHDSLPAEKYLCQHPGSLPQVLCLHTAWGMQQGNTQSATQSEPTCSLLLSRRSLENSMCVETPMSSVTSALLQTFCSQVNKQPHSPIALALLALPSQDWPACGGETCPRRAEAHEVPSWAPHFTLFVEQFT